MTGNTRNPFELLVQQIHKGQNCANKLPVRKIYIDEDPAKEQVVPCPRCLGRDQQNMVRYLYINLSEAIYKCEAYDCMYPFRNFKFKNFEECSVYRYELQPQQDDFEASYEKNFPTSCTGYENSMEHITSVDFNVDFLSFDGIGDKKPPCSIDPPAVPSSSDAGASFDIGFIDEILEDLFPASSNQVPNVAEPPETKGMSIKSISTGSTTVQSPCKPITPSSRSGRKLEKCLKIFEKPQNASEDAVFKKPKSPVKENLVVEPISPTRLRIKRVPELNSKTNSTTTDGGGKSRDRTAKALPLDVSLNGTLKSKQVRSLVKNKKLKPLDLVCQLNNMTQKAAAAPPSTVISQQPTVRKCIRSPKVQKMLNFIQRSMKTSDETEPSPTETVPHVEGDDRSRFSHIKIEPHTQPSTVPSPDSMQNGEVYFAGKSTGEQVVVYQTNPTLAVGQYSSELPTSSPSGGMEVLFHFMES